MAQLLLLVAELYLAWTHRAAFAPLFARAHARERATEGPAAVAPDLPARHQAA